MHLMDSARLQIQLVQKGLVGMIVLSYRNPIYTYKLIFNLSNKFVVIFFSFH